MGHYARIVSLLTLVGRAQPGRIPTNTRVATRTPVQIVRETRAMGDRGGTCGERRQPITGCATVGAWVQPFPASTREHGSVSALASAAK